MTADGNPARAPSADDIKSLSEQLSEPSLKSSTRILNLDSTCHEQEAKRIGVAFFSGAGKGQFGESLGKDGGFWSNQSSIC